MRIILGDFPAGFVYKCASNHAPPVLLCEAPRAGRPLRPFQAGYRRSLRTFVGMRIAIAGAGSAGQNLAYKLHAMGNDLIIIDTDPVALNEISSALDVMTVLGRGSSPEIIEKSQAGKCDIFVAVTSNDEVNLLACHLAHSAGARFTICRINDISFLRSPLLNLARLGVDRAVAHNERCAREIFDVLSIPGAFEATSLFKGRITAIGFRLPEGSPLLDKPLAEFKDVEWFDKVRFFGLVQGDELQIARGSSVCRMGDDLYAVLASHDTDAFMDWAFAGKRQKIRKVIVAGGSRLGLSLAHHVEKASMECILVERDRALAERASEQLERAQVLHADAAHAATLKEIGLGKDTAFAAVTDDQDTNIVSCIQAKDLGAGFTVSRIDNPDYVPIVDRLHRIDHVVSPYLSLIRAILAYVHGDRITDVGLFTHISGELQEVVVKAGNRWEGRPLRDVKLPEAAVVGAIQRGDETYVPTGSFELKVGDRLAIYSLQKTAHRIRPVFE